MFGRNDVTLDELRDVHLIAFSCDAQGRAPEPMVALRDGAGLGRTIAGTSGDFNEVCRMITAGLGIGVLPLHAVQHEIENETLWHLKLPRANLYADLFFISDPERHFSPAEARFLSIAKEIVASTT